MADLMWWVMNILGPVLLVVVLAWLVLRTRSKRNSIENERAEQGARQVYAEEELRRREGTDDR
jgi:uncharacterized membrane protein